VRATFTLAFFGFAPGLAIMGILRLDDLVLEISLALAVSLSLDTVLATRMTLFNGWHTGNGVLVMAAVTVAGALVQVNQVRQLKHRPATPTRRPRLKNSLVVRIPTPQAASART
jgi:uncharacterized membrane protein